MGAGEAMAGAGELVGVGVAGVVVGIVLGAVLGTRAGREGEATRQRRAVSQRELAEGMRAAQARGLVL